MMISDRPTPGQLPQLRTLWETAFGDEGVFLDRFYETAYSPDRCRCITLSGKIAAVLYWFDTFCGPHRFAYVYAVATDPAFRHRGLCTALMDDTRALLKARGYHGIVLYPASETLSRMYEKMGFRRCTWVSEFKCEAGEEAVPLRKIGKIEYARLRRALLPEGGVIQEGPLLDFLETQADFYAGEDWVAAVSADAQKLHCHELLGNRDRAPGIVRVLGCKTGFFRTSGREKPFAMAVFLVENCTKPVYFGLPLD